MTFPKEMLPIEMYYKAIEGSDSGLWVLDFATSICYLSDRYYTMLGYEPQEFVGTMENLFALLHPDDVERTSQIFNDYFQGKISNYRNEVRLKTKNGQYLTILTQGIAERDKNGVMTKFIGWNIDISPLKEAQKKLDEERIFNISQSRLAQIGLLSGGVSHEVNNPLTVIQLRSERLLMSLRKGETIDNETLIKNLEYIYNSSKHIESITNGLNTIAGSGELQPRTDITLKSITEEVIRVYQSSFKNDVRLTVDLSETPTTIFANGPLLAQAMMNLINNALDAVESLLQKEITIKVWADEKKAYFRIQDNGPGIRQDEIDKIMLPFYTTKDPGKGSGLGLSIAKSIVESQGGEIHFSCTPGLTTFTIRMPLSSQG